MTLTAITTDIRRFIENANVSADEQAALMLVADQIHSVDHQRENRLQVERAARLAQTENELRQEVTDKYILGQLTPTQTRVLSQFTTESSATPAYLAQLSDCTERTALAACQHFHNLGLVTSTSFSSRGEWNRTLLGKMAADMIMENL